MYVNMESAPLIQAINTAAYSALTALLVFQTAFPDEVNAANITVRIIRCLDDLANLMPSA